MKFQNPSLNSVLNGRTDKRTNGRTHKPKAICSPLFQSWGHNQRTSGPVNAHLISWPSKAQNIHGKEMTLTFNTHIPS